MYNEEKEFDSEIDLGEEDDVLGDDPLTDDSVPSDDDDADDLIEKDESY